MRSSFSAITPALVTQKAVRRLPRWALLMFCAAYVLPGLFGRDPWKNADITAFGHMWSIALGQASWLHPNIGGVLPAGGGILPYWLGAAAIRITSPWMDPALAARIPFALILTAILALTWYACYYLARTDAAQPLPLAFGGEALPQDYARAVADGALLALIASLGLLLLGHETTPELIQLLGSTLFLFSLAIAPNKPRTARITVMTGLACMALSGSPTVAALLGMAGTVVCSLSRDDGMHHHRNWVIGATILSAGLATLLTVFGLSGWQIRLSPGWHVGDLTRLMAWFAWPTLPLAALTIWHWRRQIMRRHIAVPMGVALIAILSSLSMGASDRALLLALPALAILAAFSLPILQRSLGAALDWFSVCFFTTGAILVWLTYGAMFTGRPAQMAANVSKLVPGYVNNFSAIALIVATLGSALWLALVRWRTSRHTHALWKSLVLPAGGVALWWLLAMTLMLPPVDQARSYRLFMVRVQSYVPAQSCVAAPDASTGLLTALEYFGGYEVHGTWAVGDIPSRCGTLMVSLPAKARSPEVPGWILVARVNQRTRNSESVAIFKRSL